MPSLSASKFFPPAEQAIDEGLLCVGGRLNNEWLLDAYSHGIFPWPIFDGDEPMAWWSPDPRAIFMLDGLYISQRLARTCRSGKFTVTCDRDFAGVMKGCGTAQKRHQGTWITPAITRAYCNLHTAGHAHSIEVWHAGELAGGTYGIAIGGLFAAESMFYRVRDASKVALVFLLAHLNARGYQLLDIQQLTDHTESLGAVEIPRDEYLKRLDVAIALPVTFGDALHGCPIEGISR
jgi:leucyl/phenylalanyl-tRNA--protein transferase